MKMQKYYVLPKDKLGQRMVLDGHKMQPTDMSGVQIVELPKGDYLTVISRGKEYPAYKIARAIAIGQIEIKDVKGLL